MSTVEQATNQPKATSIIRVVELVLGGLFILAAFLKAMDANTFVHQIFQYGVFEDRTLLGGVAVFTLFVETALGIAMLLGLRLRGLVPAIVLAMLLFFTVLIAWAWPEDCGCFGGSIKMGPEVSIAKNVLMMLAAGLILYGSRNRVERSIALRVGLALALGLAAGGYAIPQVFQPSIAKAPVVEEPRKAVEPAPDATSEESQAEAMPAPAPAPAPGPYAGYVVETEFGEQIDVGVGDYLVATLSMTCEHCMAAVPTLNELSMDPALPRLVAFALEPEPGSMIEFTATTGASFPMLNFGNNFLEFSKFMGNAPPRVALVRNGTILNHWDEEIPDAATIREAVLGVTGGS